MNMQTGSSGNNVRVLQEDLNAVYPYDQPLLKTDGIFGMKTKNCVMKFQRANFLKVDGIVGPITLSALQSKRPGRTPGAPPPPPVPGVPGIPGVPNPNVPPNAARFQNEMRQVFEQKGKTNEWQEFWSAVEQNKIPTIKVIFGVIGRAEDARTLAKFFIELRSWGFSAREIGVLFAKFNTMNGDKAIKLFELAVQPAHPVGKVIKFAGDAAAKLGLIVTLIECAMHASRGDYSVIPAEIYKFVMGKAIPWAAMIEGIGSLLDGVVPEQTRKTSLLFRIMRGFDPIGLGAAGVDSLVAIVICAFEMILNGKVNADVVMPRLQRLVARLKQGPTAIFAEIGENSGDAMYELSQMELASFNEMMNYSWMEMKEFWASKF